MDEDADIVERSMRGDGLAFRDLVDRHAGRVRSRALRGLGDLSAADDAAQEVFYRAYRGLAGLRDAGKFGAWVVGIADRVVGEFLRRRRRSPVAINVEPTGAEPPGRDDELTRVVERLAEPYRETVLLRYWAGMTCEQVAEQQRVPLGTVTKRLSRAHGMLREMLGLSEERNHELRRVP